MHGEGRKGRVAGGIPQEAQGHFLQNSLSPFPGPQSNLQVPGFPSLPHLTSKTDFPLALFPPLTKLGISWLVSKGLEDPGSLQPDL